MGCNSSQHVHSDGGDSSDQSSGDSPRLRAQIYIDNPTKLLEYTRKLGSMQAGTGAPPGTRARSRYLMQQGTGGDKAHPALHLNLERLQSQRCTGGAPERDTHRSADSWSLSLCLLCSPYVLPHSFCPDYIAPTSFLLLELGLCLSRCCSCLVGMSFFCARLPTCCGGCFHSTPSRTVVVMPSELLSCRVFIRALSFPPVDHESFLVTPPPPHHPNMCTLFLPRHEHTSSFGCGMPFVGSISSLRCAASLHCALRFFAALVTCTYVCTCIHIYLYVYVCVCVYSSMPSPGLSLSPGVVDRTVRGQGRVVLAAGCWRPHCPPVSGARWGLWIAPEQAVQGRVLIPSTVEETVSWDWDPARG